jgi:hypothetical protein
MHLDRREFFMEVNLLDTRLAHQLLQLVQNILAGLGAQIGEIYFG